MKPRGRRLLTVAWLGFVAAFVTATIARELVQPATTVALGIAVGILANVAAWWWLPPVPRTRTERTNGRPAPGPRIRKWSYRVRRPGGDS